MSWYRSSLIYTLRSFYPNIPVHIHFIQGWGMWDERCRNWVLWEYILTEYSLIVVLLRILHHGLALFVMEKLKIYFVILFRVEVAILYVLSSDQEFYSPWRIFLVMRPYYKFITFAQFLSLNFKSIIFFSKYYDLLWWCIDEISVFKPYGCNNRYLEKFLSSFERKYHIT